MSWKHYDDLANGKTWILPALVDVSGTDSCCMVFANPIGADRQMVSESGMEDIYAVAHPRSRTAGTNTPTS